MHNWSLPRMSLAVVLAIGMGGLVACDSSSTNLVDGGGPGDGDGSIGLGDAHDFSDADPNAPDAGASAGCSATGTQCNNCIDDDHDGLTDGFDPQCASAADELEGSFATGISGDNIDQFIQDCFFDGNSGGGDDKCAYHTCCLTDVNHDGTCSLSGGPAYDPADCTVTQQCINNCAKLATPGCDCFGCCTVCADEADPTHCVDIATSPAISPECTQDTVYDPTKCKPCAKSTQCAAEPCGGTTCTLCPGQLPSDLPDTCNPVQTCPNSTPCTTTADCTGTDFCSAGCCTTQIG
jgi:hypothetical protein